MNDNKRKLYDALSNDYDMGTYEQFRKDLEDKDKRRKLYDATSDAYDFGDYDQFEAQLGYGQSQSAPSAEEINSGSAGPVMPKPAMENRNWEVQMGNGHSRATVEKPEPVDVPIPQRPEDQEPSDDGTAAPSGDVRSYLENANRQQVANLSRDINSRLDEAQTKSRDIYMKEQEDARKGGFLSTLAHAIAASGHNPEGRSGGMSDAQQRTLQGADSELQSEISKLEAAKKAMSNAEEIIAEADKSVQEGKFPGFFKGIARGFGDKLFDVNTWDLGVSDTKNSIELLKAIRKYDEGEPLSESEQMLLDAKSVELATNAYFGSYIGRGYKAGAVTAQSLPFMLEMAVNPASTLGESTQSMLARYALSRFAKKGATRAAQKFATKAAGAAGRALGDIAGSAVMAGTSGAVRVAGDAIDRHVGDIKTDMDGQGQTVFAGHDPESLGKSIAKAFTSTAIENHSEMLGEYFAPALGIVSKLGRKGMEKFGLKKVVDFVDDVSATDAAKLIADFQKRTKWNGTIGEYAEEVVGNIENAILVGDNTLDASDDTGVFNLDQNIDTFLGVALMGGVFSAVRTAMWRTPKYRARMEMEKARDEARTKYGSEAWQEIEDRMAEAGDSGMSAVLSTVIAGENSPEKAKALLDYAKSIKKYEGMLAGDEKRREIASPEATDLETSYENGYTLSTPQEVHDAKLMFEYQEAMLQKALGTSDIDIDTIMLGNEMGTLTDEQKSVAMDYLNAKATFDGVIDRVRDDIDSRISSVENAIDASTNRDTGMLQPASLVDDRPVHIISGIVRLTPDGTMVDTRNSENFIIVRDDRTGRMETISPSDINRLENEIDPAMEKQAARQQIQDVYGSREADSIDGVLAFNPGDTYTLTNEQGQSFPVQIVANERGSTDNGDGTVNVILNNDIDTQTGQPRITQMPKEQIQEMAEATNLSRLQQYEQQKLARAAEQAETDATGRTPENPFRINDRITLSDAETGNVENGVVGSELTDDGKYEVVVEKQDGSQSILYLSPSELEQLGAKLEQPEAVEERNAPVPARNQPVLEQKTEKAEQESAMSRIPLDRDGVPQFEQAQPSDTWEALLELNGGNAVEAEDTARQMYENASKNLDKAQKTKPKSGTSVMEIQRNKAERNGQIDELRKSVDFWGKVLSFPEAVRKSASAAAAAEVRQKEDAKREAVRQAKENLAKGRKLMQQKGTYYKDDAKLGDYLDFHDYALRMIANGRVKFVWKNDADNNSIKGLGGHLGLEDSESERKALFSLLANQDKGGLRPDDAAEQLSEEYNSSLGAEVISSSEALDVILDIIRTYGGKTRDMMNAAIDAHAMAGMDERVHDEDSQGNPINSDGSLYVESVSSIDEITDEDFTNPTRSIVLPEIPQTVDEVIGANGKPVVIKKNIFMRNSQTHPEVTPQQAREIISSALYRPDLYGQNQKTSRPYNWIVINTKDSAGQNRLVVLEVNENKDNVEIIHWYNARNSSIEQIKRQAQKEGGLILILPSETEEAGGLSSRQSGLSSEGKDNVKKTEIQEGSGKKVLIKGKKWETTTEPEAYRSSTKKRADSHDIVWFIGNKRYGSTTAERDLIEAEAAEYGGYVGAWNAYEEGKILLGKNEAALMKKMAEQESANKTTEALSSNSSEKHLAENQNDLPDLLPAQENNASSEEDNMSSGSKDTNISEESNTDSGKSVTEQITEQREVVNTEPTEAQKEAGNYRMGHVKIDGMDVTIENPKGSIRRGTDADGKKWESEMHYDYGYIRGTKAVDNDHIDIFLSDNPETGNVFVVDQVNPKTGEFDESKVMYGFASEQEARDAYLSNYEKGWKGLGKITEVTKEEFKKWIESSTRKTKPFSEYASVKTAEAQKEKGTSTEVSDSSKNNTSDKASERGFILMDDFIESALQEAYENRTDKSLSRDDWNEEDEAIDAENKANDDYYQYIESLSNSGELQKMYDASSIGEQIKMRKSIGEAGHEFKDLIDTTKAADARKEAREKKKKEEYRLKMKTLGIDIEDDDVQPSTKKPEAQKEKPVQGLEGYSRDEIKGIVTDHINDVMRDYDIDAEIIGMDIHGSRNRHDARPDSDLDVVVEYSGDIREDDMFNALNGEEDALSIEGIKVDINPIRKEETGDLQDYMKQSEEYDKEKLEHAKQKGSSAATEIKNNKSEKIEDYGEQISGARKDMLRDLAKTIQNTSLESLISLPFSKAFKKPNLRKAVEEGALRDKDARFAQAAIAAFLSTKKPVAGTKDERRRQRWGEKTNVEKWAEKAYTGIKILQELFDVDERVRDKVIEAAVADKYVGVAEAKAQQQRMGELNYREFNGTSYPLNLIALYNEVFDRLGYPAGQDTKIPVGRIVCDSTFDSYSLRGTNGENWLYSSRSLKSFEDVVDELVYLIKVANADETADHPIENFKIRGINPKVETTGYRVLAAKNLTTAITRGNRFAVDEIFPTREAALKRIEELKATGLECSEPLEKRETVGYEKYQISFAHPITREFIPLEKEYGSKEEAIAAPEAEHEELNRLANEAIAAATRKSGESVEKSYFHITHYYDKGSDGKYHWYYGVALDDKYGPKKTAFNTMPFFLAERLNSREEAQKQIDANKERWESLVKDVVRQRSNFVYFSGNNETRKGEDYRNGKDVTAEEFANKFGFRGVQFGNWANQADRQAALNNAYDSFMDMSKIIGVSPKAMSLNGELGVAFGSRGSGAASAHYEPGEVVINLTKTRGAGSLAHEWWHALDNYFSRAANVKLGYVTSDKRLPMREEMRKAFNDLVDDVEKSDYHTRSMDRGSGYWGTRVEETARLFAEWIADEMAKRGELNNFLAGRNDSEDSYARMGYVFYTAIQKLQPEGEMMTFEEFRKTPMALKGFSYPTRAELETLGKDVRNIFGVVQERTDETTGDVSLFQMVDKILSDNSPENRLAYEAVSQMLSNAGIPVEFLSDQAMREMAINATMLDTALPEDESSFKGTVISSIDGTKILRNLDNAIDDYQNIGDKGTKTFLGDLASALGSSDKDKSSQYATFETKNGQVVTIRVSNHNATVSNFDNAGESNGISIVISRKPNEGMTNDGDAHIVEFFYPDKALNKADGKPLVEILKSIKQSLYSGEYKDTTGLAQREEVNAKESVEFLREPDGTVYGATVGGKIYLNRERLNPNTPIHEYTHLWFSALEKANPELYKRGVELMKQLPIWEEVKTDPNYANLSGDDAIASECLSRLVGDKGAAKLTELAKKAMVRGDIIGTANRISLIEEFKDWLKKFWTWVRDSFAPWTKEEASRVSVDDIQNMVLSDLAKGVNPLVNAREESELKKTNDKFNEQLETFTIETADRYNFNLGRPSSVLLSAGIENKPIRLHGSKVAKKIRKHGFQATALRDLPKAIAHPIAVFDNLGREGNRSILTELKTDNGNVLVSIDLGRGTEVDFNIVSSVFGKNSKGVLGWINGGKMKFVDKEKALNYLHLSAPIAEASDNAELLSAANIVKEFENPSDKERKPEFQFIGEKGAAHMDKVEEATIRLDNLSIARQMEDADKDAKTIKLATGWERGADGKWRYEISDANIKDTIDLGKGISKKRFEEDMLWNSGRLGNVIEAPELFKAYPQLKDVHIETDSIVNDVPSNGEYNANRNRITIHADRLKYLNSILNHEIQHAIQHIEGFATGGTPEHVEKEFDAAKTEWRARAYAHELEETAKELGGEYNLTEVENALGKEYKELGMEDLLPDKETRIKGANYFARGYADRSMDEAIRRFRLDESPRSDFNSYVEYMHIAGEVEARNVSARLGMTPEERRRTLALETEDVSREDQIILNDALIRDSHYEEEPEIDRIVREAKENDSRTSQDVEAAATKLAESLGEKVRIIRDVNEIESQNEKVQESQRRSKGWFNTGTGEIVVVLPNATGIEDVQATILHEAVGHKGLRELVGDDRFDDFLDKVYAAATKATRLEIVSLARRNHWDFRLATEEYIAGLAEKGFSGRENRTLFGKIKDFFLDMLSRAKIALGFNIGDNELRYMLWRTYQMRTSRGILAKANDMAIQQELKVGNFREDQLRGRNGFTENDIAEMETPILESRGTFAKLADAEKWAKENLQGKTFVNSFTGDEINISGHSIKEMLAPKFSKAINEKTHMAAIMSVPDFIETGIPAEIHKDTHGRGYDVMRLYNAIVIDGEPYRVKSTVKRYVDGDRYYTYEIQEMELLKGTQTTALGLDDSSRPQLQSSITGANLLKGVKKTNSDEEILSGDDSRLRFRTSGNGGSSNTARDIYEEKTRVIDRNGRKSDTANLMRRLKEAYVDSMQSLKYLQDAISEETGKPVEDFENAYLAENSMSSKNKAQTDIYLNRFFNPIKDAIRDLQKEGAEYGDIVRYLMAKHGLERNEVFSKRDAEKDGGVWDGSVRRDYSGLTELTRRDTDTVAPRIDEITSRAEDIVRKFEMDHDTDVLWEKINDATKDTLRTSYITGMLTKDNYEMVRSMFRYYIPLRGWSENTASAVYDYLSDARPKTSSIVKAATGRTTISDDPIATIAYMGQSAIIQGNRNLMKQKLLNLALNHKTGLLTVSRQWEVLDPVTGMWTPRDPDIPADAAPEQVADIVADFEKDMKEAEKKGVARLSRGKLDTGKHLTAYEGQEHIIKVKRGGIDYSIYLNGNPRAAQAVNGMTNPDAVDSWLIRKARVIKNFMARMFTSQNPAFIISNLSRDVIFAGTAVYAKEDAKYAARYAKNITVALAKGQLIGLIHRFETDRLDNSKDLDRYFGEFIRNGGETGFTQLNTVDDFKRDIDRFAREMKQGQVMKVSTKVWNGIWDGIEYMNRCAEDATRFSVYMTSRQMGRSVERSISDAKEITVNFNRKGSGGFGARLMNFAYIFFNAAVQSLANAGKIMYEHPMKALAALGAFSAAGFMAPLLAQAIISAFGGDDDAYWDLPEWVRRNNFVFYIPWSENKFLIIPISQELRPFYAMGEIAMSVLMGKEEVLDGLKSAAGSFMDLLPIDFMGNGGNLAISLTPTVAQPLAQLVANTDYFGSPIYRRNDYNKLDPAWTKAYKGTSPMLVNASKWLNEVTGGDDVKRGWIDPINNPAVIEHLFESYLGGTGKTINRAAKTFSMIWNPDMRDIRNVPIASTFIQESDDERVAGNQLNREYFKLMDEFKETSHTVSGYKKKARMGSMEYADKLNEFMETPDFERYSKARGYANTISKLRQALKRAQESGEDVMVEENLQQILHDLKRQMVEELKEQ